MAMDNHKLKTIVVEDEIAAQHDLLQMLEGMSCVEIVGTADSVEQALPIVIQQNPDVIFLDVELKNSSGFELVSSIQALSIDPQIIFTTAYHKYAIQAIRCAAFDFLLKPILEQDLHQAINRALTYKNQQEKPQQIDQLLEQLDKHKRIRFNTRSGFILVDPTEIDYIQADWNYSELFLQNGKNEVLSMNIGSVEKVLPCGRFHRISRSIIINLEKLLKVDRKKKSCLVVTFTGEKEFDLPAKRMKGLEMKL